MRSIPLVALLVLAAIVAAPAPLNARLFWQTYGATVAAPDGDGCAWNVNSDYFVPRNCDSCRYDLFSMCKSAHGRSPACKYLHPIYNGYCTPYGPCHYRWRDHVYKKYCGCMPLRSHYGGWHLDKCRKHCLVIRPGADADAGDGCGCFANVGPRCSSEPFLPVTEAACACSDSLAIGWLPNVEPMGGESLGTIEAFPAGLGGAAAAPGAPPSPGAPPRKLHRQ